MQKMKGGIKFHFFIRTWSFITEMTGGGRMGGGGT